MDFNSPVDSMFFGVSFGAMSLLILIALYAVYSVPLSIIEWRLFCGKSIFKNMWQALKINVLSVLLTALCAYVVFVLFLFSDLIPHKEWLAYLKIGILVSMSFVLFLLIKLRSIGFMSKNRSVKIQLFFFNLLSTALFSLIIYLIISLRLRS